MNQARLIFDGLPKQNGHLNKHCNKMYLNFLFVNIQLTTI